MKKCRNKQDDWRRIPNYQQFFEFPLSFIELLTAAYYNKLLVENIGEIKKNIMEVKK